MSQTIRRKGSSARKTAAQQGKARKVQARKARTGSALDSIMAWLPFTEEQLHRLFIGAILFTLMQDWLAGITPQYWEFWIGLVLLGFGWNLSFIGATTMVDDAKKKGAAAKGRTDSGAGRPGWRAPRGGRRGDSRDGAAARAPTM